MLVFLYADVLEVGVSGSLPLCPPLLCHLLSTVAQSVANSLQLYVAHCNLICLLLIHTLYNRLSVYLLHIVGF